MSLILAQRKFNFDPYLLYILNCLVNEKENIDWHEKKKLLKYIDIDYLTINLSL